MNFKIVDYDIEKHKQLDQWNDEKLYLNAKQINDYALYDEPLSSFYNHFQENPFDMANIRSFIKVVEGDKDILGAVVFHYYLEDEKYYLTINPIVINPLKMNQGIGTNILRYIIKEAREIADGKVDYLRCNLNMSNEASIRLFTGRGFIEENEEDGGFKNYFYKLKKKSKYKEIIYVTLISLIAASFYLFLLSLNEDLKGIQMILAYIVVPLWMFSTIPAITYWVKRFIELNKKRDTQFHQSDLIVLVVIILAPYFMFKYYKEYLLNLKKY